MKRIILSIALATLCILTAFSQNKYKMVVQMTNGTETAFSVEDIERIYYFKRLGDTCPDGNHPHMIDLGLPSGTKWACCNVGATTPEGYGGIYAWGETKTKDYYAESTYEHATYDEYGTIKNYTDIGSDIAGTSYDVARVRWGSPWRMPSRAQFQELIDNCTSTWTTTENGVDGYKFTGPNGKTIFFPPAGRGEAHYGSGSFGSYWSSTLSDESGAYRLSFSKSGVYIYGLGYDEYRWWGYSVRPVR